MDHHSSGTKRFLLEPISPSIFFKSLCLHFHSIHARCRRPPTLLPSSAHAVVRRRPKPLPSPSATTPTPEPAFARVHLPITASLARCLARLPPRHTPPSC
ncbi:hypothetical protein ACLOJK_023278 [Asimina triloba]